MATANVISDVNNAQPLTLRSSLTKKLARPVSNGINMSKTGIILKYFAKKTHDGCIIEPHQYKYHHGHYHDQYIITYLAALQ